MSDRVILAVKFTPAGPPALVRKAVGGFLRYVQHRDVHPGQPSARAKPEIAGLLKYVAYRENTSRRAELFGPRGTLTSDDRKAFAAFVAGALDGSAPQIYRDRDGTLRDRRRAAYRFVISPERAEGLDLQRLTRAAVSRLEQATGIDGLRWIAAVHRNTAHHHVHLVVAGMRQDSVGAFHRVDLSRSRLAAMKEVLAIEIQRQRGARTPLGPLPPARAEATSPHAPVVRAAHSRRQFQPPSPAPSHYRRRHELASVHQASVIALRAVARRYEQRMQRELEDSFLDRRWERAA
jgi:relaxase-like protein